MPAPTQLLYLHGFRSSPQSAKARLTADRVAAINVQRERSGLDPVLWLCPQLPASPRAAVELALRLTGGCRGEQLAIIGSSLGGYYATWLAQSLGCRAALLNPAVAPARDLAAQIGHQTSWHDPASEFSFTADHVAELRQLQLDPLEQPLCAAARLLAVIALNDEVLNCHEMLQRYRGAALRLSDHGGHALDDYAASHLNPVLDFLGVTPWN